MKESFFFNGFTFEEGQNDLAHTLKDYIKEYVLKMIELHVPEQNKDKDVEDMHKHTVMRLLPLVRALNYESLKILKANFFDNGLKSKNGKKEWDIFMELLPITGTWPAALVVQETVLNNELKSDIETARLLTSIPFHVEPVKALVDEYFKLVTSSDPHLMWPFTRSAIDLSYAHLVRKACHDHQTQEECFKGLHIEEFFNRFEALNVDDHNLLHHYMLVFYNFRESEIMEQKLKAIIFDKAGKVYSNAIKTQAIFAIESRAIRMGKEKELFLPIFLNRNENHEVRIAAFDALMRGYPTTTTFNKIMTYMIFETDFEVFNYVYTAFDKFATHYNEPCGKGVHEYAKYFIKYWKQHMWQKPKYTIGVSKTFSNSFMQDKYGYSGSIDVHTVGSKKATTPISIMVDVRAQNFQHLTTQMFGIVLRMEGVAEKIVHKIRTLLETPSMGQIEKLKEILFTDLNIRERKDVPAKFTFFLMLRDNIVFEFHLQDKERELNMNFEKFQAFFHQIKSLSAAFDLNKHFGLSFATFLYEQPTDFGVPMAYVHEAVSMLGVGGKFKKDADLYGETDFKLLLNTVQTEFMTVFHPDHKHRFAIRKQIVYKHQLDSGVKLAMNFAARKMKLEVKVPKTDSPFSMEGHSQTIVYTEDNRITKSNIYLKKSCPTCLMYQVMSNGKDLRRGGNLLKDEFHEVAHIYGMEAVGRYFDCELPEALSPGQRFLTLIKSFNPMRKEPKNLINIVLSGMHRFYTFLYYVPRIESCGMSFMLSQSFENPVDRVVFDFDLRKLNFIDHPRKLMKEKSLSLVGDITFSGMVKRVHHVQIDFKVAPMWTKTKLDIEIRRKPFVLQSKEYKDFPIILYRESKSVPLDGMVQMKDLKSVDTDRHRVQTAMELTLGNPDIKIRIEGDHKTTAEALDHLRSKWYYKTCMDQHFLPEWRMTEDLPMTDACLYALHDLYTLRHYHWDIIATNLEPWMVSMYKKIGTLIKTTFFPFWEFKPEYTTHEISPRQPRIHIDQVFHTRQNTFDLKLQIEKDVSRFMGINYGYWQWNDEPYLSLPKLGFLRSAKIQPELVTTLFYNNIINHCVATSQTIRTFDNVTYPYHMDHNCWTLISSDCSEHPSFAVFMRKDEQARLAQTQQQIQEHKLFKAPLGLMVFLGDQKLELLPLDNRKFDLKINDQGPFYFRDKDFMYFATDQEPEMNKRVVPNHLFKIIRRKDMFVVDFFPHMMIRYDGNSMQVLAGPQVKGRHCGMCGDYNRNMHYELVDPQMCHLMNGDEMALAWTLDKKFCQDKVAKPACKKTVPGV